MSGDNGEAAATRRTVLRTVAGGAAAAGLATVGVTPALATSVDLTGWFEGTDNATRVTDRTGNAEVTVEVGTDGNGAGFGFGPAVVRVDPGTTVRWTWTGKGGSHNVVAADGSFESDLYQESGESFTHTVETTGVTKYFCRPHKAVGMKGAVVVGDTEVVLPDGGATATAAGTPDGGEAAVSPDYGGWFDDVSTFDGTVDRTGRDEVRIEVGAAGNGGNLAFSPTAVHVDPGTRVVWEWTGEGGQHNVYSEDPQFESPLQTSGTYALEFDGSGVCKYACEPHEAAGMKGAVVVGDPETETRIDYVRTFMWGLAGSIVAAPYVASEVMARRRRRDDR